MGDISIIARRLMIITVQSMSEIILKRENSCQVLPVRRERW